MLQSSLGKGGHHCGHGAREGARAKWSLNWTKENWEDIVHTHSRGDRDVVQLRQVVVEGLLLAKCKDQSEE